MSCTFSDDEAPLLRMLCDGDVREALFSALNIKDAAALRAVSPRLREEVAQHPWGGARLAAFDDPVDGRPFDLPCKDSTDGRLFDAPRKDFIAVAVQQSLTGWCASFPRARHINICWTPTAFSAYSPQLPLLSNLQRVHFDFQGNVLFNESMDLSSLHAVRELIVKVYSDRRTMPYQVLLGRMPSILHLELLGCSFNNRALETLTTLQTLVIRSCWSFDSSVLKHLNNLVKLDTSSAALNGADLATLTKLRALFITALFDATLYFDLTDAHLAPLVSLERLSLNVATDVTGAALRSMPNLTHVALRDCYSVTNDNVRALWGAMAQKAVHCELVLCSCWWLTPACIPFEYDEPFADDIENALQRMQETPSILRYVMYSILVRRMGFDPVTANEALIAIAKEYVKLYAVIHNLPAAGNVTVHFHDART